jgi:hypothetical protein
MPNIENKRRILKDSRENRKFTYKDKHVKITSDLSAYTLKARKL